MQLQQVCAVLVSLDAFFSCAPPRTSFPLIDTHRPLHFPTTLASARPVHSSSPLH